MKKFAILVVAAAFAVGAVYFYYQHRYDSSSAATSLTYHGNVELRRVNLSFRVGGRISEILAEEGDSLTRGAVFARLDREPFDADVSVAQGARDQAAAAYEKAKNGPRPQELAEARAQVEECKATLRLAESEFSRNQELIGKNAVSQSGYDASLSQRDAAQARLSRAEANLALLEEGTRSEELEASRAALAQAEASLEKAKIAASDVELVAPNDGILLTRVAEVGAMTSAGQTVATLSLRDVVWVYIFVEEPDLGKVAPGTDVEIRTDSSDFVYRGHVGYVSPEAEFTPKTVETPNLRTNLVYRARIVVDNPDQGLRQGAPVDVAIPIVPSGADASEENEDVAE